MDWKPFFWQIIVPSELIILETSKTWLYRNFILRNSSPRSHISNHFYPCISNLNISMTLALPFLVFTFVLNMKKRCLSFRVMYSIDPMFILMCTCVATITLQVHIFPFGLKKLPGIIYRFCGIFVHGRVSEKYSLYPGLVTS